MKGGVLEVLLVDAKGLKGPRVLGSSNQYVVIECGIQSSTSKISLGKDRRDWWNEKFVFELSPTECKELTQLRCRIMERDKFREDCFIGEATVYMRGILKEGTLRGSIELKPAPHNLVLKDGTFQGELKVGLKFIPEVQVEERARRGGDELLLPPKKTRLTYTTILNYTWRRIPWPKLFFLKNHADIVEIRNPRSKHFYYLEV